MPKGDINMTARIILLNGVGSAGKTSIAAALQNLTAEPFLRMEMDMFLSMMPAALQNHPDGLSFDTTMRDGKPNVLAKTGPVAERSLNGMRHAVAAMAAAGNNLIVDEVIFGDIATESGNPMADYRRLLAPYHLLTVGVFASLDVLEERERQRGDRMIGLARSQYDMVHRAMVYDLKVDTTDASPEECAAIIKNYFSL
ncbi:MAG: chloramphenicol phosphotransferase CPT family protein [Pikeienuella sp.]